MSPLKLVGVKMMEKQMWSLTWKIKMITTRKNLVSRKVRSRRLTQEKWHRSEHRGQETTGHRPSHQSAGQIGKGICEGHMDKTITIGSVLHHCSVGWGGGHDSPTEMVLVLLPGVT